MGLGVGGSVFQEGLVLLFVTGVAIKETTAGELADLFTDELLFIKTVAQPLLQGVDVEAQALQEVVGAEPLPVVGEPGVGFDEVVIV